MSNLFNALEQARRERHREDPGPSTGFEENRSAAGVIVSDSSVDADVVAMFKGLQEELPKSRWAMQLVSAQPGEGVSSVARRFARVSADLLNKKVLLMQLVTNVMQADQGFRQKLQWQEIARRMKEGMGCEGEHGGAFLQVSVPFKACLKEFKDNPDSLSQIMACCELAIFDTPSPSVEPYSVEFSGYVDAVLIVLEAERTKAFAVQSLKEKILSNSGAVLGVVFNKRYFHIPHELYSKLH